MLLTRVVLQHADIPGATLCEFGEAVLRNVAIDLDKDVWGSKLSGVDKTAYKVGLNLNYAF